MRVKTGLVGPGNRPKLEVDSNLLNEVEVI